MFGIRTNLKNYELVCKIRDHHEPLDEDVADFKKNVKFPKSTYCRDCGCSLELKIDQEDSGHYWIREI